VDDKGVSPGAEFIAAAIMRANKDAWCNAFNEKKMHNTAWPMPAGWSSGCRDVVVVLPCPLDRY
jgi:hypothetical protein